MGTLRRRSLRFHGFDVRSALPILRWGMFWCRHYFVPSTNSLPSGSLKIADAPHGSTLYG